MFIQMKEMLLLNSEYKLYTYNSTVSVTCSKKNIPFIADVRLPGIDLIALGFRAYNRNQWQLLKKTHHIQTNPNTSVTDSITGQKEHKQIR